MQTSMFSLEEHPANHSRSLDSEKDLMIRVVTSPSHLLRLLHDIAPAGWSGRTSPAYSRVAEDETLQRFWACSREQWSKSHPADGRPQDSSPEFLTPTESRTECLTLSIAEFPSGGVASSLSDILETTDLPQRYFLSSRACAGILRRAARRGKELPAALLAALESVAGVQPREETPSPKPSARSRTERQTDSAGDAEPTKPPQDTPFPQLSLL